MARSTIEKKWKHAGLDCAVLLLDMGHRCGYVKVPDEHPWHGLGYDAEAPGAEPLVDGNTPVADAVESFGVLTTVCAALSTSEDDDSYLRRISMQVRVHGGVTYAGKAPGDLPDGWWFGFDTAHADDSPAFWTVDAMAAETERLAEQVASVQEERTVNPDE